MNEKIFSLHKNSEDDEQEGETPEPPKEQEYSFIEVRVSAYGKESIKIKFYEFQRRVSKFFLSFHRKLSSHLRRHQFCMRYLT